MPQGESRTMPRPRFLPLPLLLCCVVVVASWSRLAHAGWVLPPGPQARVEAWLAPLATGQTVTEGWSLEDLSLQGRDLRLGLIHPPDLKRQWVVVTPTGDPPELAPKVTCPPALPEAVCARVRQALGAKTAVGAPWQATIDYVPPPPVAKVAHQQTERQAVTLTWVLLAMSLAVLAWQRRRMWQGPIALGVAGITVLGLVLRSALSPWTFLHENYRIGMHTAFLVDGSPWPYGEAMTGLAAVLDTWTGAGVEGLFAISFVGSVLAIPALMALDAALFGARRTTLGVGLAAAMSPVALRFAACEEPWSVTLFLAATAMAAWVTWLRDSGKTLLAVTVLASALTMQSRPEWLAFPLVLLALSPAVGGWTVWRRLLSPSVALAAVLGGALLVPKLWWLDRGAQATELVPEWLTMLSVYSPLDQAITSPLYVALVVGGLFWGWRHVRAPMLTLFVLHLGLSVVPLLFFATAGPYAQRTQLVPLLFLAIPAGHALDVAIPWLTLRGRVFALVLVIAAQLATRVPYVKRLYDQQLEWNFLQSAVPQLPTGLTVLTPHQRGILADLPEILPIRHNRAWRLVDPAAVKRSGDWPAPDGRSITYLGMACYVYSLEPDGTRLSAADGCAAVRARYRLEPLLTHVLPDAPYPPTFHQPAGPEGYAVGFYWLRPL